MSADPGCGKSVLARAIIDEFMHAFPTSEVTICYFFFKDNDEQNRLATALCSVLHQLFSQQPQLLDYAIKPWESNGNLLSQDVHALWRILLEATSANHQENFSTTVESTQLCDSSTPPTIICIFDALDECPKDSTKDDLNPRTVLLDGLQILCNQAPQVKVSLLILSRADLSIKQAVEAFHPIRLALGKVYIQGDISRYLDRELAGANSDNLRDLSPEMRTHIKEDLLRRAGGM